MPERLAVLASMVVSPSPTGGSDAGDTRTGLVFIVVGVVAILFGLAIGSTVRRGRDVGSGQGWGK